jgi:hypothetical protein
MWQVINPNTYVTSQEASNETVTTAAGTIENATTPLTPFWKNSNEFYTSLDVRGTERFGNAYPETQSWTFPSTRDYQASVRTAFRGLYGGSNLAFILANSQRGRLSTGAQIQPVRAETQTAREQPQTSKAGPDTSKPETESPKANPGGSILKGPMQKAASISASVVSSVRHGLGSEQIPLRNTGNSHGEKGHGNPKDGHGNPKDGQAPHDTKDTSKDTQSPHQDKGRGKADDGEPQKNPEGTSKDAESSHQNKGEEASKDSGSHREPGVQGKSHNALDGFISTLM